MCFKNQGGCRCRPHRYPWPPRPPRPYRCSAFRWTGGQSPPPGIALGFGVPLDGSRGGAVPHPWRFAERVALPCNALRGGWAPPSQPPLQFSVGSYSLLFTPTSFLVESTPVIARLFLLLLSRIIDPYKQQFSDKRLTSYGIERNERPNRCLAFRRTVSRKRRRSHSGLVFRLARAPYLKALEVVLSFVSSLNWQWKG